MISTRRRQGVPDDAGVSVSGRACRNEVPQLGGRPAGGITDAEPQIQSQPSREPARSATRHYEPPTANRSMSLTTMTRTKATMAHPPDKQQDRSGWDTVDPGNRPPLDALRVTPERAGHILDGDASGRGGHRHGVGNPGKTEFPASWDDKKIMDNVHDVARRPDQPPIYQAWNSRWLARGTRDDVEVVVVVASDGCIWSGWPRPGSPGVVSNPRRPDEQV